MMFVRFQVKEINVEFIIVTVNRGLSVSETLQVD